jgi:hypothetical protein
VSGGWTPSYRRQRLVRIEARRLRRIERRAAAFAAYLLSGGECPSTPALRTDEEYAEASRIATAIVWSEIDWSTP